MKDRLTVGETGALVAFRLTLDESSWSWSRITAELVERGLQPRETALSAVASFLAHYEEVATRELLEALSGGESA